MKSYAEKATAFISSYLDLPPNYWKSETELKPEGVLYCRSFLIDSGLFSDLRDLQKQAIKEQGIIFSFDYFKELAETQREVSD